jgi:hypothetical protein
MGPIGFHKENAMTRMHRPFLLLVPFLAVLLPSCGGSSSSPSTPSTPAPTPTPAPVRRVLFQGSESLGVLQLRVIPFTTTAAVTLDITVDWTFATNLVAVYLAQGNCTFDQFVANQCNLRIASETATPKPKVLTVPDAAAGAYTFFVGNVGPTEESVSFQVGLTSASGASVSTASVPRRIQIRPWAGRF